MLVLCLPGLLLLFCAPALLANCCGKTNHSKVAGEEKKEQRPPRKVKSRSAVNQPNREPGYTRPHFDKLQKMERADTLAQFMPDPPSPAPPPVDENREERLRRRREEEEEEEENLFRCPDYSPESLADQQHLFELLRHP